MVRARGALVAQVDQERRVAKGGERATRALELDGLRPVLVLLGVVDVKDAQRRLLKGDWLALVIVEAGLRLHVPVIADVELQPILEDHVGRLAAIEQVALEALELAVLEPWPHRCILGDVLEDGGQSRALRLGAVQLHAAEIRVSRAVGTQILLQILYGVQGYRRTARVSHAAPSSEAIGFSPHECS